MKKKLCAIIAFLTVISTKVFAADAHLEGEENNVSVFEKLGIDSEWLMENWYIIVIIIVCIGCAAGLIYGNTVYFAKKHKNKKEN